MIAVINGIVGTGPATRGKQDWSGCCKVVPPSGIIGRGVLYTIEKQFIALLAVGIMTAIASEIAGIIVPTG
jgi:hypothetical protein